MHVVIAGASGFLGTHLRTALGERGHQVTALVRRPSDGKGESTWDPYAGTVDQDVIGSADVVVNLAGAPLVGNPHSKKWARAVRESRVRTTDVLAEAVASAATPPAFLAGNGVAIYGDRGDTVLTEDADSRGHGLLTEVSREWEAAAAPARDAGSRVCILRTVTGDGRRLPAAEDARPAVQARAGRQARERTAVHGDDVAA